MSVDNIELTYLNVLRNIILDGADHQDRTGVGTKRIFGTMLKADMSIGFPLLTTKTVYFKGIIHELLWFIKGDTNIKYLTDNNVNIWNEWADEAGDLGPVYGKQLRNIETIHHSTKEYIQIDQLKNAIDLIKNNPESRRNIITLWNPVDLPDMRLPPCHGISIHFNVINDRLDLAMYQRSCDMFLGVPFNIASYALFLHMVAQVCDLKPGIFTHILGDAHIYTNHMDQVNKQILRTPLDFPTLKLNPDIKNIDDFTFDDIVIENYKSHGPLKAPVAV